MPAVAEHPRGNSLEARAPVGLVRTLISRVRAALRRRGQQIFVFPADQGAEEIVEGLPHHRRLFPTARRSGPSQEVPHLVARESVDRVGGKRDRRGQGLDEVSQRRDGGGPQKGRIFGTEGRRRLAGRGICATGRVVRAAEDDGERERGNAVGVLDQVDPFCLFVGTGAEDDCIPACSSVSSNTAVAVVRGRAPCADELGLFEPHGRQEGGPGGRQKNRRLLSRRKSSCCRRQETVERMHLHPQPAGRMQGEFREVRSLERGRSLGQHDLTPLR